MDGLAFTHLFLLARRVDRRQSTWACRSSCSNHLYMLAFLLRRGASAVAATRLRCASARLASAAPWAAVSAAPLRLPHTARTFHASPLLLSAGVGERSFISQRMRSLLSGRSAPVVARAEFQYFFVCRALAELAELQTGERWKDNADTELLVARAGELLGDISGERELATFEWARSKQGVMMPAWLVEAQLQDRFRSFLVFQVLLTPDNDVRQLYDQYKVLQLAAAEKVDGLPALDADLLDAAKKMWKLDIAETAH